MIEVRRCRGCGQAAAVCVRDWQHASMGVRTGQSTRDFRCQSCGRAFTLVPKMRLWVFGAFAVLFSWTIVLGVLFGGWTAWRAWAWAANPVVPDAPAPAMRFRAAEPGRRCSCGAVSVCTNVTRRSTNGIPTGTEYEYQCTKCRRTFSLESPWGVAFNLTGALLCFVIGFGCLPFGILVWLMALVLVLLTFARLVNLARFPVVRDAESAG